jgi:hypothetical protein
VEDDQLSDISELSESIIQDLDEDVVKRPSVMMSGVQSPHDTYHSRRSLSNRPSLMSPAVVSKFTKALEVEKMSSAIGL